MWQCENCGYTDEDGTTFEVEEHPENPDEPSRYCPECGSDEVFGVDEPDSSDNEEELARYEQPVGDWSSANEGTSSRNHEDEW